MSEQERRQSVKELCEVAARFEHHLDMYSMEQSQRRRLEADIMQALNENTEAIKRIEGKIKEPMAYINDVQGFGRTGRFIGKVIIFVGAVAAGMSAMYVSFTHFRG